MTAKRVLPEFLEKLRSDVFPLFERLRASEKLARIGCNFENALWSNNPRRIPFGVLAPESGLEAALREWARKFNAEAEWIFVGALRALWLWRDPLHRASLDWSTLHSSGGSPAIGTCFGFSHPGWETRLFTWARYQEMIRQEFEKKLSEYGSETRNFAESEGLVRTRRQYSRENLEWFVLYQFAAMSSKKIADRYRIDDSTVLKGVKTAARLLAWGNIRRPVSRDRKSG